MHERLNKGAGWSGVLDGRRGALQPAITASPRTPISALVREIDLGRPRILSAEYVCRVTAT